MENDSLLNDFAQSALRGLMQSFFDFERQLGRTGFLKKRTKKTLTIENYREFLLGLRAQVIEGSRWISRCASSFDAAHSGVRSLIITHAQDEHRDYELLESDYKNCGGDPKDFISLQRNVGSDALHGFLMYRASRNNPVDLLGAMWMIEGLGQKMASDWAVQISELLSSAKPITKFLEYHGINDTEHLKRFYEMLDVLCTDAAKAERIQKTAQVVARLYVLQIEEINL